MDRDLYKLVHGFCRKNYKYWEYLYEYDDYVQDSFVKILSVMDRFDGTKSSLSNFVYDILLNYWCWFKKFHKYHQDRFERTFMSIEYDDDTDNADYNLDERVINDQKLIVEEMEEIEEQDWLTEITPYLNKYSYDYYIKGRAISDIAKDENTTKQNISAKIQRNIKKIKKLVDNGTISCYN